MREIKFRAWNKKDNAMIQASENFDSYLFNNKIIVPMQFTGLKDKNGKEIYEGDILRANYQKRYFWVIKFKDGNFHFFVGDGENADALCFCENNLKGLKVVGNIYENTELLNSDVTRNGGGE